LEFLIAQDVFINQSGAFAYVFLPATPFAEKDETFTNTDRHVQTGKFRVLDYVPVMEEADDEYPFILTTGQLLEYWHGSTITRNSALNEAYPKARAGMHGITNKMPVRVTSRRSEIVLHATVTEGGSRGGGGIRVCYRVREILISELGDF